MPDKGRRVASRQAQLGRRRRRQARGPVEASAAAPAAAVADAEPTNRAAARTEVAVQPEPAVSRETQVRATPSPRTPRASVTGRSERPAAHNYVGSEIRRILIVSGVLFAGLVGVSFLF